MRATAGMVEAAGAALGDMTFCSVAFDGLNRRTWRAGPTSRVLTFFQTSALRAEGDRVELLLLCYQASRIVPPQQGRGPVSLSRVDIDVVVTEYGAADLRGLTHSGRAFALIEIAGPCIDRLSPPPGRCTPNFFDGRQAGIADRAGLQSRMTSTNRPITFPSRSSPSASFTSSRSHGVTGMSGIKPRLASAITSRNSPNPPT